MRVAGLLALCLGLSMAVPGPSLEEFLRSNGFGNVTERFLEEDITMAVVRNLTDGDLREMGLRTIGRRRQFMAAVRSLNVPEVVREVEGEESREEEGEEEDGEGRGGERVVLEQEEEGRGGEGQAAGEDRVEVGGGVEGGATGGAEEDGLYFTTLNFTRLD